MRYYFGTLFQENNLCIFPKNIQILSISKDKRFARLFRKLLALRAKISYQAIFYGNFASV